MEPEPTTKSRQDLRLTIELVPFPLHGINLRIAMRPSAWDKLSKSVRAGYEGCGVCGTPRAQLRRLSCDELFEYDDELHVARLRGFNALCDLCHHVKHIGHAGLLADRGKLDFEQVVEHFLKVNQCTRQVYEQHYEQEWERFKQRSKHQDWLIDLGEYAHLVPKDYTIIVGITVDMTGFAYEKKPFVHQYDEEKLADYRAEMKGYCAKV